MTNEHKEQRRTQRTLENTSKNIMHYRGRSRAHDHSLKSANTLFHVYHQTVKFAQKMTEKLVTSFVCHCCETLYFQEDTKGFLIFGFIDPSWYKLKSTFEPR
eukprot:CCRYP_009336-RA/>CCRYP_009336-RA protein AED:0.44 eAED:0.44 QI:337/1/1/1/0/0/2/0/101